jgi:hypothetical protein
MFQTKGIEKNETHFTQYTFSMRLVVSETNNIRIASLYAPQCLHYAHIS